MNKTTNDKPIPAVADRLDGVVINLLGDDAKIDALLEQLDILARESNSYEYGLPLYDDGQKEILRKAVLKWLLGL